MAPTGTTKTVLALATGVTADQVQCWLVDREYDDRNLVTLTYATPDGDQALIQQRSQELLARRPATAAITVEVDDLEPVDDPDTKRRYADEVTRVRSHHDPGDTI